MNENHTKELLHVHLEYVREDLKDIRTELSNMGKQFHAHNEILLRNTITVEEHERRSTMMEKSHDETIKTLLSISASMTLLQNQIVKIENDLEPIKAHTEKVNKLMRLFIILDDNKKVIGKIVMFVAIIVGSAWVGMKESQVIESLVKAMFK